METRKSNIIHYEVENEGHIGYAEGYIIPFEDYTFGIFRNMTKRVEAQLETINEKNKLTMALKAGNLSVWSYLPESETRKADLRDAAGGRQIPFVYADGSRGQRTSCQTGH